MKTLYTGAEKCNRRCVTTGHVPFDNQKVGLGKNINFSILINSYFDEQI